MNHSLVQPLARMFKAWERSAKAMPVLLCMLVSQYSVAGQVDIKSAFRTSEAEQRAVSLDVSMGEHFKVPAIAEATKQGNGVLTVGNLSLRLQDRHDDGLVYGGDGLLRVDLERLEFGNPKAGTPVLVVSGILTRSGEKEGDPVSHEAITVIYQLDCRARQFKRVFSTSSVDIDLGIARTRRVDCPKH